MFSFKNNPSKERIRNFKDAAQKKGDSFLKYLNALGGEVFSYGNATHAFLDALKHIKHGDKKNPPGIIMPSYIPAKLYRILFTEGYLPVFYEINQRCEFNVNEVLNLIDENTVAIFAVHYFGHPSDVASLRQIADSKNISLIEDCAHVLPGNVLANNLGTTGDFSIFSVRKMLTLSDGGYLLKNRPGVFTPNRSVRVSSLYSILNFLKSRSKRLYFILTGGKDIFRIAELPKRGFINYDRIRKTNIKNISLFTQFYSRYTNLSRHIENREENYNYLNEGIRYFSHIRPLFNESRVAWTPYSFPVLVKEGYRDRLQAELLKGGISCGAGWPESPFEKHFLQTKYLSQNLLELPVNHLISRKQLDTIISICAEFDKGFAKANILSDDYSIPRNNDAHTVSYNYDLKNEIIIKPILSETEFDSLKEEWNELCEKSSTHIFQTYEWQRLWWKNYGSGKQLFILAVFQYGILTGLAPLFVDVYYLKNIRLLKRLRFIGSITSNYKSESSYSDYSVSDYLDLIIRPGFESSVAECIILYLRKNSSLFDKIEFDEVSARSNVFKWLLPRLDELSWNYKIHKREICPRIHVPGSLSDFMQSLNPKIRYQLKKIERDISKDKIFEVIKIKSSQDLEHEFDEFVGLHQKRWNAKGLPGAFVDERFKNFLKEISSAFLQKGWLYLTSAYYQQNCIAVEYAFRYKNFYYDYLKAFDNQPSYSKYRPGRALLLQLIKDAISDKAQVVDLLRGSEPYKFEIASQWHWVYKIAAGTPERKSELRIYVFCIIFYSSLIKRRILREAKIANMQLSRLGLLGFISSYFPMTIKKLKDKYFRPEPAAGNIIDECLQINQKDKLPVKKHIEEIHEKVY